MQFLKGQDIHSASLKSWSKMQEKNSCYVLLFVHNIMANQQLFVFTGLCGLSLMKIEGLLEVHPALNVSQRAHQHLYKLHEAWENN